MDYLAVHKGFFDKPKELKELSIQELIKLKDKIDIELYKRNR